MHIPQKFLQYFHNRELDELYASIALRSFALSMIAVFVPIFLLRLGYPLASVFMFEAVICFSHMLCVVPAAKFASRYGFKHAMFFSLPLFIAFYLLLYTIEFHALPIVAIAAVFGAGQAFFWTAYHVDFAKFSERRWRGSEVGVARIFVLIAVVLGPAIGGILLSIFGFNFVFALAAGLLLLSSSPLFFSQDIHEPLNFSFRQIFRDQKFRDAVAFIGEGIETGANAAVWPIFVFFAILNSFTMLGFAASLSFLFSLLFTFLVGLSSDAHRRLLLKLGAVFLAALWVVRSFIRSVVGVFVIDSFYGMAQTMRTISFDAVDYDKATESNIVEAITFREIMIPLGRCLFFIAMVFIGDFLWGFMTAAGASLLLLLF